MTRGGSRWRLADGVAGCVALCVTGRVKGPRLGPLGKGPTLRPSVAGGSPIESWGATACPRVGCRQPADQLLRRCRHEHKPCRSRTFLLRSPRNLPRSPSVSSQHGRGVRRDRAWDGPEGMYHQRPAFCVRHEGGGTASHVDQSARCLPGSPAGVEDPAGTFCRSCTWTATTTTAGTARL